MESALGNLGTVFQLRSIPKTMVSINRDVELGGRRVAGRVPHGSTYLYKVSAYSSSSEKGYVMETIKIETPKVSG